jgi:hypothetical protein
MLSVLFACSVPSTGYFSLVSRNLPGYSRYTDVACPYLSISYLSENTAFKGSGLNRYNSAIRLLASFAWLACLMHLFFCDTLQPVLKISSCESWGVSIPDAD